MKSARNLSASVLSLIFIVFSSTAALADNQRPSVVQNVRAVAIADSGILVTWQTPSDNVGVNGFNVYKNGNYYTTIRGTTRYLDESVSRDRAYQYQVVAFDDARNYSTLSSSASATLTSDADNSAPPPPSDNDEAVTTSSKPNAPTGLSGQALSGSAIELDWNAPSGGAEGYNIYLNGNYSTTVKGRSNGTMRGLVAGETYRFQVVAFRSNKFSTKSSSIQVQTASGQTQDSTTTGNDNSSSNNSSNNNSSSNNVEVTSSGKPAAPSGLRAQASGNTAVELDWNAPSGGAEGYNIYLNGSYSTTVKGRRDITINGLVSGETYQFQVVAFRNNQWSTKSSSVQVQTGTGGQTQTEQDEDTSTPTNNSSGVPAGYNLVFRDEFNGSSVDSSKWSTRYRWGPNLVINGEQQYYVDILSDPNFGQSPFKFDGNAMTISATRTPDWLRQKANNQPYLSGAMTTHNKFKMKYGYVEMRAQLPRGQGLWPAFWLLHDAAGGKRPEIDVVEMLGDNTRVVYQTYHYYDNGTLRSTPSYQASGSDYANGYHTYAMKWEPGSIKWYVDGRETNSYSSGSVSTEDMYILVNVALGGSWAGNPDGSTPFPASFKIDYIRAYQK